MKVKNQLIHGVVLFLCFVPEQVCCDNNVMEFETGQWDFVMGLCLTCLCKDMSLKQNTGERNAMYQLILRHTETQFTSVRLSSNPSSANSMP